MNKKVQKVIEQLEKENQTWIVTLLGDEENKENGFYIMMTSQAVSSNNQDVFYPINRRTLQALLDAEIEFKTNVKWV